MAKTRHRILVVDDSSTIRAQIVESIKDYADCVEAVDGSAGLEVLRGDTRIDAVLSDLEMPVMDGLMLLQTVRAEPRWAQLPIIIITTVTDIDVVNQCRRLGCSGFVLKPVNREYLLAKLRRLLKE
jgi:two-component system chemotaxis response regulator CheY